MDDIEKTIFEIDSELTGENLTIIDIDEIETASITDAKAMVDNLSRFYYDEDFMKQHPNFKKRIDSELESLRLLIKMRKADEKANDAILNAISSNNNNASLYRALTEIQKTIISITTKMNEIVTELNNMMKGFQLELNFDDSDEEECNTPKTTCRGSKEFIKQMMDSEKKEDE